MATNSQKKISIADIKTAIEIQLSTEQRNGADYSQLQFLNSVMSDLLIRIENMAKNKLDISDIFGRYEYNTNTTELEWVND